MPMVSTVLIIRPEDGEIDRLYKDGRLVKNVGCLDKKGYRYLSRNNKTVAAHRVIWEHVNGEIPPKMEIDHIDGNPSNNKISNLRVVTKLENAQNKHKATLKNKTSGVKGVHWDKNRNKWRTHIVVNQKQIHIGRFDNLEDAVMAYRKAAAIHHTHNPHAFLEMTQQIGRAHV